MRRGPGMGFVGQAENGGHWVKRSGEGQSARGRGQGAPHHLCWRGSADCPYDSVLCLVNGPWGHRVSLAPETVSKWSGAALDRALGRRPFLSQTKCSRGRCRGHWDCLPEAPSTGVQALLAWPTQGPREPLAAASAAAWPHFLGGEPGSSAHPRHTATRGSLRGISCTTPQPPNLWHVRPETLARTQPRASV